MAKTQAATLCVRRIRQLVTGCPKLGEGPLGLISNGAVALSGERILWVGPDEDFDAHVHLIPGGDELEGAGGVVTPGWIDCHTHTVFAGSREAEFEMRAQGRTYQEIAAAGGGIASTMGATRAASEDLLLDKGLYRLTAALSQGITTVEIKSGYGLSLEAELKMLRTIQMLGFTHPVEVVPTFLGAHVVPPERRGDRGRYIDEVVQEMLPAVVEGGLAEYCDVFCEEGAFSVDESRRILQAALDRGLGVRVHADQLSPSGGAALAAELGAASADHVEYAQPEAIQAMAEAGVVAVLLPGAAFFLGQAFPSARAFLDEGVEVALATDFNPGTSPTQNLALMGTMAVARMGMSPAEALRALTLSAARALGREETLGTLEPGKIGDLALFGVEDYRTLFYHFGANHCVAVVKDGATVHP